jgi:hypothetical protein
MHRQELPCNRRDGRCVKPFLEAEPTFRDTGMFVVDNCLRVAAGSLRSPSRDELPRFALALPGRASEVALALPGRASDLR